MSSPCEEKEGALRGSIARYTRAFGSTQVRAFFLLFGVAHTF